MRVAVSCAIAVLVVGASSGIGVTARCGAPTDHDTVRPKPSSFAPHHGAQNRVYGAPIQPRILKSRPKKKDPELRNAPLPES